jgi:hypothetical protein
LIETDGLDFVETERVLGLVVQVRMYQNSKETKGLLLVSGRVAMLMLSYRNESQHRFRFSVPHDRLFLDALERDLKREKEGTEPTTEIIGEPARSFRLVDFQAMGYR